MDREVNIGLIGLGYIGKVHTVAYRDIPLCYPQPTAVPRLAAVLRSRLDTEGQATSSFALATTDPAEFYAQPLHLVDVCSPNYLHREHVEAALQRHLPVYCEKPLACSLEDARAMAGLAKEAGVPTQVAYVLRYLPAIRQIKALVHSGALGDVLHFRARMFHGSYLDADRPMSWRLRRAQSGGGAFMDLGAHLVDLSRYLLGDVANVRAAMRTFICDRCTVRGGAHREAVDVDDWTLCTLELASGTIGTLEVTRVAAGSEDATGFEVYGSKGAAIFEARHPEQAQFHDLRRHQWLSGHMELPAVPGERPIEQVWPNPKYSQGYMTNAHMAAAFDFLLSITEGRTPLVDFEAAAAAQEVIEAAYESAAREGERIRLPM